MLDCCIIGAGASGLFLGMQLPKHWSKLILEQRQTPGTKILLSGKGRCNFTNLRANFKTYLGDETSRLHQLFSLFGPKEMIDRLSKAGIQSKQEDFGRMLLASNKASELLNYFLQKNEENLTQIQYATCVEEVQKQGDFFRIMTSRGVVEAKRVVIATGGQSFPKVGGSDFIFDFAKNHKLAYHSASPALCGITTQENLSSLSGSSIFAKTRLFLKGKAIYEDDRAVLFTHRGLSGPAIFNVSLRLGYLDPDFKSQPQIKLTIPSDQITKRLLTYLKARPGLKSYSLTITPQSLRSYDESKVMSGGLLFSELSDHFELKKLPGCYVLGEAINITGKTGGYNLQRCRTSAYLCATYLNTQS